MKRWYAIALVIVSSPVVAAPPDWQWEHPAPFGGKVVAVAGNGAVVHGVGERGSIVVSRDGGTSWHAVSGDTTQDLHAVAETGKLVVAVGVRGAIVRSRDGETFKRQRVASKQSFVAVDASASAIVVLASSGGSPATAQTSSRSGGNTVAGFVLRSRDAGQTWHEERVPTRAPMFDAVITDAATFVLGNVDVILRGPR